MTRLTKYFIFILSFIMLMLNTGLCQAEVEIKMDTTTIKGNTELPQILYIVPWKEIKQSQHEDQQLLLHSLYGNLFNPVIPDLTSTTLGK